MKTRQHWYDEVDFPVTVCDTNGIILEMNQMSIEQFKDNGGSNLLGRSLLDCHPEPARSMLVKMLETKTPHSYISEEDGVQSLNYETPWYVDGEYRGFVEISIALPKSMHMTKG